MFPLRRATSNGVKLSAFRLKTKQCEIQSSWKSDSTKRGNYFKDLAYKQIMCDAQSSETHRHTRIHARMYARTHAQIQHTKHTTHGTHTTYTRYGFSPDAKAIYFTKKVCSCHSKSCLRTWCRYKTHRYVGDTTYRPTGKIETCSHTHQEELQRKNSLVTQIRILI